VWDRSQLTNPKIRHALGDVFTGFIAQHRRHPCG
jgi:hypothetical protein